MTRVLAVSRGASDCREGGHCVGPSLFLNSTLGYRQPDTTSSHERAFRDGPPASHQGGGGGGVSYSTTSALIIKLITR